MKTILALLGLATLTTFSASAGDSCCSTKRIALSPRAEANKTYVAGKATEALAVRGDLGNGARAKATGQTGSAAIQIAPLK